VKKLAATLILFLSAFFAMTSAFAQVRSEDNDMVRDTKVAYVSTYPDGAKENVLVAYQASVYHRIWQSGRASTWDHLIDDRKCHVTISAKVERRAYIVSRSGINAPLDQYTEVYAADQYTDRGADRPWEIYHTTCGEVMQRFLGYVKATKNNLNANFDKIIAGDGDSARTRLREMLKAQKLEKK
jgi:hypothetical protein